MSCAKRTVEAWIETPNGHIYKAANDCLNPQQTCPRVEGENYEKCKTICRQQGHAEVQAIEKAGVENCKNATLHISGHDYICIDCAIYAKKHGITTMVIHL